MQDSSYNFSASALGIGLLATATVSAATALPGVGPIVRIVNEGPNVVFVGMGNNTIVAAIPTTTPASNCIPIAPGFDRTFTIDGQTYFSAICRAGGSAQIDISQGYGS